MESQKLVPVNCSDSQGGGISQMGQFQLSGEISHPGPSFSLIQNIQKYVLCLPEKMTVNPCPKDNNNNNNLDFSPLMCTEHLSLCRLISLKVLSLSFLSAAFTWDQKLGFFLFHAIEGDLGQHWRKGKANRIILWHAGMTTVIAKESEY